MKRLLIGLALLLSTACGHVPPVVKPVPPTTHNETVTVWAPGQAPIPGAQVTLEVSNYILGDTRDQDAVDVLNGKALTAGIIMGDAR